MKNFWFKAMIPVIVFIVLLFLPCFYIFKKSNTENISENSITLMTDCFVDKSLEVKNRFEQLCYADTGIRLKIIDYSKNDWELFLISRINLDDVADIIKAPDNILPLIHSKKIIPLTGFIVNSGKMSDLYRRSPYVFDTYRYKNEIYGVGKNRISSQCLWVRKDMMEKLEIQFPEDMEQLKKMLSELKNFNKDVSAVIYTNELEELSVFASAFGLRMEIYWKNGKYYEPFFQRSFYMFAEYIKELYSLGVFGRGHHNSLKYRYVREKFGKGEGASVIMWDNIYSNLYHKLESSGIENFEIAPLPPFRTSDGIFGIEYLPPSDPFAITSKCSNPEAAFRVLEWIYTYETGILASSFGIEGLTYTVDENNRVEMDSVEHLGQGFPQIDEEFIHPYTLPAVVEKTVYYCNNVTRSLNKYEEILPRKIMMADSEKYSSVYHKLQKKRNLLFYNYIFNKITFEKMVNDFEKYYLKHGIYDILDELNCMEKK